MTRLEAWVLRKMRRILIKRDPWRTTELQQDNNELMPSFEEFKRQVGRGLAPMEAKDE